MILENMLKSLKTAGIPHTGACIVDNHIVPDWFVVQRQDGLKIAIHDVPLNKRAEAVSIVQSASLKKKRNRPIQDISTSLRKFSNVDKQRIYDIINDVASKSNVLEERLMALMVSSVGQTPAERTALNELLTVKILHRLPDYIKEKLNLDLVGEEEYD